MTLPHLSRGVLMSKSDEGPAWKIDTLPKAKGGGVVVHSTHRFPDAFLRSGLPDGVYSVEEGPVHSGFSHHYTLRVNDSVSPERVAFQMVRKMNDLTWE